MSSIKDVMEMIQGKFSVIYNDNPDTLEYQNKRYSNLIERFQSYFPASYEYSIVSAPGRTEISGNHTDHNGGKVLAASIDLDTVIVFAKSENSLKLKSDKYSEMFEIDINNLSAVSSEEGTTNSLLRGIAAGFKKYGYNIGGFNAVLSSDVIEGSGLSSSASLEVAICSILNILYNNNSIAPEVIAKIGQFAENEYFGKPCGLMDQMACAVGGVIAIDFRDELNPEYEKIDFNLDDFDYKLLVVNTGSSHENLTDEYSSIPVEMKSVANYFSKKKGIELEYDDVFMNLNTLRKNLSDRAILRILHFFTENKRVDQQTAALKKQNMEEFLKLVNESGNSSFKYLQNIFSFKNSNEQPLSVALALTEEFIKEKGEGACRVHGGGFAGTIQAFIKNDFVPDYLQKMISVFGKESVYNLNIRSVGPYQVL